MKTFPNKILTKSQAEQALDTAVALVRQNLPLYTDHCQNHSSVHDIYPQCENNQWTCGFWPGEVWLSYERTGDEAFKNTALTLVDSFLYRIEHKIEVDHHDMGFLYSPSCVAAYKLTGSEKGRKAAILAALGAADNYRYIIDCLLNVPLLYWASETTGDAHYADLAHKHVTTCLANSIRPDGSTYHTFFMDPVTGGPVRGATCQGYKDDSCWARGQAWGVYGTAISWDMTFTSGTEEPRDSSSTSIVACGLLEAAKYVGTDEAAEYTKLAAQMMGSVAAHYAVKEGPQGIGLVRHGTYSKKSPYNTCTPEGVDECVSWGDYFYMEALTRLTKDWELYW